jgi:zinc/manganese transport system permease protein
VTDRPWRGLALSAAIAVGSMWIGLALSYRIPSLPPGTAVIAVATATFVLAAILARLRRRGAMSPAAGTPDEPRFAGAP